MKLDITKLPLGEALIGFVLAAVVGTFVLAFAFPTQSGLGDKTATGSPTPEATSTPQGTPSGTPTGGITVSMKDNLFEPKDLTVKAGASVTFDLKNEGVAPHNMRIAGSDGSYNTGDDAVSDPQLVNAGETAKVSWTAPAQAGQIKFQCDFHVALGMVGTITVQ
ncbi:MAG: plastocyanin/azurin family copper-binding protein [Dehalococcoidia bacterium]|nr:plastocyanin/azurin family copper-binding protein [Dehalococcoidia bacterium]